jgi:hypothetical protein
VIPFGNQRDQVVLRLAVAHADTLQSHALSGQHDEDAPGIQRIVIGSQRIGQPTTDGLFLGQALDLECTLIFEPAPMLAVEARGHGRKAVGQFKKGRLPVVTRLASGLRRFGGRLRSHQVAGVRSRTIQSDAANARASALVSDKPKTVTSRSMPPSTALANSQDRKTRLFIEVAGRAAFMSGDEVAGGYRQLRHGPEVSRTSAAPEAHFEPADRSGLLDKTPC